MKDPSKPAARPSIFRVFDAPSARACPALSHQPRSRKGLLVLRRALHGSTTTEYLVIHVCAIQSLAQVYHLCIINLVDGSDSTHHR